MTEQLSKDELKAISDYRISRNLPDNYSHEQIFEAYGGCLDFNMFALSAMISEFSKAFKLSVSQYFKGQNQ